MDDLLDTYSRMKLLEMARSDYDVDGLIGRYRKLAAVVTGQNAAEPNVGTGTMTLNAGYPVPMTGTSMGELSKSNVVEFPLVDDAIEAGDPEPAKTERKKRVAKVRTASGKRRGRPAKVKASDTGDAPGDAPETAPVGNGAMPHVETTQQVEQPPMAA